MKLFFTTLAAILFTGSAVITANDEPQKNMWSPGMKPVDVSILKPIGEHPNTVAGAIYADPSRNPDERARDLIRRMTFEEKTAMTGGWNRFLLTGVERLGIRPVSMGDASQGIRLQTALLKDKSTSFPGMLPLASTWNSELALLMGEAMGEECRALGMDILLGPGGNMQRLSVGGRNFEYLGEDPWLTSRFSTAYVKGLQGKGVIATPKHFLGNDQDFCRHIASSDIDERTLREIYLPPWEAMIAEADCLGLMTGNNLVNGVPNPMNRRLLTEILRNEYGFRGLVMTDWQNSNYYPALQDLVLTSGLTLLMPDNETFCKWFIPQAEGSPERRAELENLVETMIYPTLYSIFAMGIYDRAFNQPEFFDKFENHRKLAARIGEESIVMLKNDRGILPIGGSKKILLMGTPEIHSGTGSGFVTGYDHVSYADGLRAVYGPDFTYEEAPDDKTIRNADIVLFNLNNPGGEGHDIPFDKPQKQIQRLKEIARLNRNVIVLVNSCNGMPTDWIKDVRGVLWCYFLGQERGTALARIVSGKVSPSGKLPFTLERSFADSPDPDFNFIGGKPFWDGNNQYKPYWLEGREDRKIEGFSEYVRPGQTLNVPYSEGIYIGYRWYDRMKIPVVYPFGYGLSYTSFGYESISCDDRMAEEGRVYVTVRVKNTGKTAAQEVVQVYVSDPVSSVDRPSKELKAFGKIHIEPGQTAEAVMELDARSFSFWDESRSEWKLEPGKFIVSAGGSGANLPLSFEIIL